MRLLRSVGGLKRQGRYLDAEHAVRERRIACICRIPGVPDHKVALCSPYSGESCSRNQTSPAPKKQVATLERRRRAYKSPDHPETVNARVSLAAICGVEQGNYAKAENAYRDIVA